jgi:hypothetical protein
MKSYQTRFCETSIPYIARMRRMYSSDTLHIEFVESGSSNFSYRSVFYLNPVLPALDVPFTEQWQRISIAVAVTASKFKLNQFEVVLFISCIHAALNHHL